MADDRRLIEDYLPIQAISKEASREKNVRKGHISTLHLWWARRPLVACRAAVYGALVPASQFVPSNGPDNKKQSLGRANAAKFVTELCKYPGSPRIIAQAQEHILNAHAERLMAELAEAAKTGQWPAWVDEFKWPKGEKQVTRHDIERGRAPRPRVLDMFAGGGAIPLEALRLGCEAYALDLNPVAHIIQLCTLVYPQKYGKPDPTARGMTGPKNAKGETTWGGLAEEVRYWGNWVLERVKAEIGDLYPLIPDPEYKGKRAAAPDPTLFKMGATKESVPPGYLIPVAYLWTRTVECKNPTCGATVPLLKQTWLCKKKGRYVALRMVAKKKAKNVAFEVVEGRSEGDIDFDPTLFSKGGNATCPFCGTVNDIEYVKEQGRAGRMGERPVAVVATGVTRGWVYLTAEHGMAADVNALYCDVERRLAKVCSSVRLGAPDEPIAGLRTFDNSLGITVRPYGITQFRDLFSKRQLLFHMTTVWALGHADEEMAASGIMTERRVALVTFLAAVIDRGTDFGCRMCVWNPYKDSGTTHAFGRQTITMVWDYSEANPFNPGNASWSLGIDRIVSSLGDATEGNSAHVSRGSATTLALPDGLLDAVVSDPPYYDNVPYADISDFFYVWLKRAVGDRFPEHFATELTPKKLEAIADANRHAGSWDRAKSAYEQMMLQSLREAHRVLKPGGNIALVYAHKTTLGWSTLVDAFRRAGFAVTEAWPLDTEKAGRLRAQDSAALATSVFLVARKRFKGSSVGNFEDDVYPDLERIVHERIGTLWEQGITGADLVIASVGAGLRAFTKYERVEYANGEEVPAERFLAEVEGVVLNVMLEQIAGKVARGVTAVDAASRFYVLWRYVYKAAAIDAGEAIVFTYGQHVELEGQKGLASGRNPLVEKKKSTYRVRDFSERGKDEKLGLPPENGQPGETAPLIDALHRVLWIMENRPRLMTEFLRDSRVNRDQLRVLAQALAGPALKGGELGEVSGGEELAALTKLTSNWKSVIEDALMPLERGAR